MESRLSNAAERTIFKSNLKFTLIDQKQYTQNSPIFTAAFELIAPAIAQAVCHNLSLPAQTISIKYFTNSSMEKFGGKFNIELRSGSHLANFSVEKLHEAISNGINSIDRERLFKFDPSYSIKVKDSVAEDQKSLFTWKVSKRSYDYNSSNKLDRIKIEFLDENKIKYFSEPHTKNFSYRWGSPTSITYEYESYTSPAEEHFSHLETLVSEYVSENKRCAAVLKSVISKDFNQALRRTCFGGDTELVIILLKHDEGNKLNLDLNQASSNGKTPLDYAIASGNEQLIKLLMINGAKTKEELFLSLADTDRIDVMQQNQRNQPRSFDIGQFAQHPSPSTFGLFGSNRPSYDPRASFIHEDRRRQEEIRRRQERQIEEIERINREAQERHQRQIDEVMRLNSESLERQRQERMAGLGMPANMNFSSLPGTRASLFGRNPPAQTPRSPFSLGQNPDFGHDSRSSFDPSPNPFGGGFGNNKF